MSAFQMLGELKRGQSGKIMRIDGDADGFSIRLRQIGFQEGARVEVVHEAPFGGDPIAIRVRGALIALRRSEASLVWVEKFHE